MEECTARAVLAVDSGSGLISAVSSLGERVKEALRESGKTSNQVERDMGKGSSGYVSRVTSGARKRLYGPDAAALAKALGVEVAWLLMGEGPKIRVAPTDAPPLRDLPTWSSVAERARGLVDELDAPLVDEVGGFVPPAPIDRVTVALVTALVTGWKSVRPVAAELPTVPRQKTFASPAVGEARSVGEKSGKAKRKKP